MGQSQAPVDAPAITNRPQSTAAEFRPAWFVLTGLAGALVVFALLDRLAGYFQRPEPALLIGLPFLALLALAGGALSERIPLKLGMLDFAVWSACLVYYLPIVLEMSVNWPYTLRLLICALALMPVGFFAGLPQAKGLAALGSAGLPASSRQTAWLLHGLGWASGAVISAVTAPFIGLDALQILGALLVAGSLLPLRR